MCSGQGQGHGPPPALSGRPHQRGVVMGSPSLTPRDALAITMDTDVYSSKEKLLLSLI